MERVRSALRRSERTGNDDGDDDSANDENS
jgi:hypothetical protein